MGLLSLELYADSSVVMLNVSGHHLLASSLAFDGSRQQAFEENGLFVVRRPVPDQDSTRRGSAGYFQDAKGRIDSSSMGTDARLRVQGASSSPYLSYTENMVWDRCGFIPPEKLNIRWRGTGRRYLRCRGLGLYRYRWGRRPLNDFGASGVCQSRGHQWMNPHPPEASVEQAGGRGFLFGGNHLVRFQVKFLGHGASITVEDSDLALLAETSRSQHAITGIWLHWIDWCGSGPG